MKIIYLVVNRDNIRYGIQFARQFVDAPEKAVQQQKAKSAQVRAAMNLHNNEAGRKVNFNFSYFFLSSKLFYHPSSPPSSFLVCYFSFSSCLEFAVDLHQQPNRRNEISIPKWTMSA
jgi:hypothetical protein